jgi:two-component system OmpR family sensor kinase
VPLRIRLALMAAIGLTVLLAGTGYAFVYLLRDSLTATIDTSLWSRHDALLAALEQQPRLAGSSQSALAVLQSGTQLFTARGTLATQSTTDVDDTGNAPLLTAAQVARARRGPLWLTTSHTNAAYPVRLLAFPLPPGTGDAVGVVSESTDLLDQAVDHVEAGFLFGGPAVVAGGAVAAWLLAGAALRPVERMRRQAASATVQDSDPVLDVPATRDEIAALARTLNAMLARLRTAVARERAFVADAGHELRTPLSILRTELELAGRPGRTREELAAAVHAAAEETDRLGRLTEGLLLLAREQDERFLHRERVAVRDLLEAVAAGFATPAAQRRVRLLVTVEPAGLTATWDQDLMRQVVANLVDNAMRYGRVPVRKVPVPRAGGDGDDAAVSEVRIAAAGFAGRVVLRVQDDGPGFPADFLPHAFERFSRADAARGPADGGAGLGLSIVELITVVHGGTVRAANRPGGGAEVTVEIPEPG